MRLLSQSVTAVRGVRHRTAAAVGKNAVLLVVAAVVLVLAVVILPRANKENAGIDASMAHEGVQLYAGNGKAAAADSIHAYNDLMAPLLFPQLYPECGRVTLPPPLRDASVAELSKSQDREDIIMYNKFFKDYTEPGVFLEIGALDGLTYSNTWTYEHVLGWKGILVEANPTNGAELRKADRPRSAKFTSASCQIPDLSSPGKVRFTEKGGAVATDVDQASESFINMWSHAHGGQPVNVPCVPLQYMIDATGLLDIDFFSLDVEDSEKIVLETVDLTRTNIKVLMVEMLADIGTPEKNEWVRNHLKKHGFEKIEGAFMQDSRNEIFVNPRFDEIKASRAALPISCNYLGRGDNDDEK